MVILWKEVVLLLPEYLWVEIAQKSPVNLFARVI